MVCARVPKIRRGAPKPVSLSYLVFFVILVFGVLVLFPAFHVVQLLASIVFICYKFITYSRRFCYVVIFYCFIYYI